MASAYRDNYGVKSVYLRPNQELTLGQLRILVAEADEAGISDGARVSVEGVRDHWSYRDELLITGTVRIREMTQE